MTKQRQSRSLTRQSAAEWSDRLSRRLLQVVLTLLVILALAQLAIQNDFVRQLLTSADRWEGTRLS